MNWVEQLARWVGLDLVREERPELTNLRAAMEVIRSSKRSEEYESALAAVDRANELIDAVGGAEAETVKGLLELHRADIMLRQRDDAAAESLLTTIMARSAAGESVQRAYAVVMLGVMAYQQGDLQVARERFEQAKAEAVAAKSLGAEARAQCHLAEIYFDEGNASYAAHLLKEGLEKLHQSGDIELSAYFVGRLGEVQIANGETTEGDQLLGRALRLAQQMRARGDQRRLHVVLARRAQSLDRYTEAYNQLEKAMALMPPNAPERGEVLRLAVDICLALDKKADALAYAEQAISLYPDDVRVRGALGMAFQAVGRADEAIPHLRAAADADDHPFEVRRTLAAAYLDTDDSAAADALYQAMTDPAAESDLSHRARALRDYGLMRVRQMRWGDAVKLWSEALHLYDELGEPLVVARLYCDIANARLAMGQAARAFKDFEQALMLVSRADDLTTRGVVLSNAAGAYVEKGDLETAESFFTEAIQIAQKTHDDAADATRQGNFGWFQWATGRTSRAQSALAYAVQLSERAGLALQVAVQTSNLAQVTADMGDMAEASKLHLRALSTLRPTDPPRWQAIIRVNAALHALKTGDRDDALTWLADAAGFAPLAVDAEAHYRTQIALALADRETAPQEAITRLKALLPAIRVVGLKRLTADALSALSQLLTAAGQPDAAETWEEARKLYRVLGHPLGHKLPAWMAA